MSDPLDARHEAIARAFAELEIDDDGCWWESSDQPQREKHYAHLAAVAVAALTDAKDEEIARVEALFVTGDVQLHSGAHARWKIECDALTDEDVATLALMLSEILPPFSTVEGVPTGGNRIAEAMRRYATDGPVLIVDDVLTTGMSMEKQRRGREAIGAVLFARGRVLPWVTPLFAIESSRP